MAHIGASLTASVFMLVMVLAPCLTPTSVAVPDLNACLCKCMWYASLSVALPRLNQVEFDSNATIRGLSEERDELEDAVAARDATIEQLRCEVATAGAALAAERRARRSEGMIGATDVAVLLREVRALEECCNLALREGAVHVTELRRELKRADGALAAEGAIHTQRLAEAAAGREAAVKSLEAQIRTLRSEAREKHADLIARIKAQDKARQALEKTHADEILTLDAVAERERSFLRAKVEALGAQILSLRSSSARGRAMFYWSSMKGRGEERQPCATD